MRSAPACTYWPWSTPISDRVASHGICTVSRYIPFLEALSWMLFIALMELYQLFLFSIMGIVFSIGISGSGVKS
jgi:hypothetical protein